MTLWTIAVHISYVERIRDAAMLHHGDVLEFAAALPLTVTNNHVLKALAWFGHTLLMV